MALWKNALEAAEIYERKGEFAADTTSVVREIKTLQPIVDSWQRSTEKFHLA